jgi:hypothetical protein
VSLSSDFKPTAFDRFEPVDGTSGIFAVLHDMSSAHSSIVLTGFKSGSYWKPSYYYANVTTLFDDIPNNNGVIDEGGYGGGGNSYQQAQLPVLLLAWLWSSVSSFGGVDRDLRMSRKKEVMGVLKSTRASTWTRTIRRLSRAIRTSYRASCSCRSVRDQISPRLLLTAMGRISHLLRRRNGKIRKYPILKVLSKLTALHPHQWLVRVHRRLYSGAIIPNIEGSDTMHCVALTQT